LFLPQANGRGFLTHKKEVTWPDKPPPLVTSVGLGDMQGTFVLTGLSKFENLVKIDEFLFQITPLSTLIYMFFLYSDSGINMQL
jgi:hypothetical protein